jgi:integrase/recombinase XerD
MNSMSPGNWMKAVNIVDINGSASAYSAAAAQAEKDSIDVQSDELYRLLKNRKDTIRIECEIVFHNKKGGELLENFISQKFKKYIRRAGFNDNLHFHSLRHSFAIALVSSGVSLYAVQKLLGHTTSRTTEIYSHLMPQQLHLEVNKGLHSIEGSLFNLVGSK